MNYIYASAAGNKEYYNINKVLTSEEWFLATFNNPQNGPDGLKGSYWFRYDSVLFISLDLILKINSDSTISSLQSWLKSVVAENEGKYQYIVIFKHFPDFISQNTEDYSANGPYYKKWFKIYDEIGADFVLSGDFHSYSRSNLLYNNEVQPASSTKGCYYITGPLVAPSGFLPNIKSLSNVLLGVGTPNGGRTHGAGYFKVTHEEMTYYLYGEDGKVYDEITIKPKRSFQEIDIQVDDNDEDKNDRNNENNNEKSSYTNRTGGIVVLIIILLLVIIAAVIIVLRKFRKNISTTVEGLSGGLVEHN